MPKKSNKTSHVLNLITNRTGLTAEALEKSTYIDKSATLEQSAYMIPAEQFNTAEQQFNTAGQQFYPVEQHAAGQQFYPAEQQFHYTEQSFHSMEQPALINIQPDKHFIQPLQKPGVASAKTLTSIQGRLAEKILANLEIVAAYESEVRAKIIKERTEERARIRAENLKVIKEESVMNGENLTEIPEHAEQENQQFEDNAPNCENETMDGLILSNILEEVMRLEAPKIMAEMGMCCCERCINDVLALALNSMPPKYVVSQRGALFAKVNSYGNQYKTDILANVAQACVVVRNSPSHK